MDKLITFSSLTNTVEAIKRGKVKSTFSRLCPLVVSWPYPFSFFVFTFQRIIPRERAAGSIVTIYWVASQHHRLQPVSDVCYFGLFTYQCRESRAGYVLVSTNAHMAAFLECYSCYSVTTSRTYGLLPIDNKKKPQGKIFKEVDNQKFIHSTPTIWDTNNTVVDSDVSREWVIHFSRMM